MITPELRSKIRRLFFGEHWKMGTIAAQLGVHRDAVEHAIERERFINVAYRLRASCLDEYKEFIDQIVLSGAAFTRRDKGSFGELVYDERGDAMPSDHCPIAVTIGAP